jgi:hypothetical protein
MPYRAVSYKPDRRVFIKTTYNLEWNGGVLLNCSCKYMLGLRLIKGKLTSVGVADERIEEMIGHGREMRCLWVYAADTEPCSAMSGILTELQKKVRRFHQSPETFWLHNRTIVNRDLIEFHSWRTPVPLP